MIGQILGHYRIVERIGAGGMGEVYRAHDERLVRDVALKLLPRVVERDAERLRRFTNEARAASALNHPHILTIYDVGEHDGIPFIAMELVDGDSLRERLRQGPLPIAEALEIAIQIAAALNAAHEKGLVHRDLKPENVMVRRDGYVKVVDFGLAALRADRPAPIGASAFETVGAVAGGTPAYMAPEQINGSPVDRRTDVFAFGILLCELLTGVNPYARPTPLETLNAIARSPEPAIAAASRLDDALRKIIVKAVAADPEHRYAMLGDVRDDLRRAHRAIEQAAELAPRRTGRFVVAAAAIALAAAAGTALWMARRPSDRPAAPAQLTHFSTAVRDPAVSPDGKLVAYIVQDADSPNSQVYVQMLPDGQARQLTRTPDVKAWPAFSPDGARLAYTVAGAEWKWDTWVLPVLGGAPQLLLRNAAALQWLPDKRVLFSEFKQGAQLGIVVAAENRSGARDIYVPPGNAMAHHSDVSPDGRSIVIGQMGGFASVAGADAVPLGCFVLSLERPSATRRLVGGTDTPCSMFVRWGRDGWLYFSSGQGRQFQVLRQQADGSRTEPITSGAGLAVLGVLSSFVLTPDGRSLIYPSGETQEAIWVRREDGTESQLTLEGNARTPRPTDDGTSLMYIFGPRFAPGQIWIRSLDGSRAHQLFPGLEATTAVPSPDGTKVALTTPDAHGRVHLWLGATDNAFAPRELVGDAIDSRDGTILAPLFSPDSSTILYTVRGPNDVLQVWRIGADGSSRRPLTDSEPGLQLRAVSPDGRWISVTRTGRTPRETWMFSTDGSAPGRKLWNTWALAWTPDNRGFLLSAGGMVSTAWLLPNPGGALLPSGLAGDPTEADVARLGARNVLKEYFFVEPTPMLAPYSIAYSKVVNHSNLYQVGLPAR